MSKCTFCNCHWSRQVLDMRRLWNNIFFMIIRVIVVINQIVLMSPFVCLKNVKGNSVAMASKTALETAKFDDNVKLLVKWKFRTRRLATAAAIILFTFYTAASPFMVKFALQLYSGRERSRDNIFITVAKLSLIIDMTGFLLTMATNIWHRKNIVRVLNLCSEVIFRFEHLEKNLIGFKTFLALAIKTTLRIHSMVFTLPHVIASRLPTQSVVAFLFIHYLLSLQSIFELGMFAFLLVFLSCSLHLEKELQCSHVPTSDCKMSQLIRLRDSLQQLVMLFSSTFQYGIFIIILWYFITILSNVYAMLDLYVNTRALFSSFATYLISLTLELYSLIYVAYLWDRSQRKVKDLFLQREDICFKQASTSPLSIVDTDVLWPQLSEFQLLGLFTLDNVFGLFLLTYSINFVVIILEFEISKI